LKKVAFNDVSISKHSIALSVSRKRDLEVSFQVEGKRQKLSIPLSKDNLKVSITLSSSLV
jgi:hypothetical protein